MVDFLSDQWFERLAAAASSATVEPPDLAITVELATVEEAAIVWHFIVSDGAISIGRGPAASPDVRFTLSRQVASGIHEGTISAQRAFLDGQLRIGGDILQLMEAGDALAALGPLGVTDKQAS